MCIDLCDSAVESLRCGLEILLNTIALSSTSKPHLKGYTTEVYFEGSIDIRVVVTGNITLLRRGGYGLVLTQRTYKLCSLTRLAIDPWLKLTPNSRVVVKEEELI